MIALDMVKNQSFITNVPSLKVQQEPLKYPAPIQPKLDGICKLNQEHGYGSARQMEKKLYLSGGKMIKRPSRNNN